MTTRLISDASAARARRMITSAAYRLIGRRWPCFLFADLDEG
jgi:hypothetical protein